MNCPNCGAQYDSSMTNCPSCGTPNSNPVYQAPVPPQQPPVYNSYNPYGGFPQADMNLINIYNQASSAYNFALAGLILSIVCGIGWIFALIAHSKATPLNNTLNFGGLPLNDYYVNEAKKKLSTAKTLNTITLVLTILSVIGVFISIITNAALISSGAYYYY